MYERAYLAIMRHKLGLLSSNNNDAGDGALISDLLEVMHMTGSDYSRTFRLLARFPLPPLIARSSEDVAVDGGWGGVLEALISERAEKDDLVRAAAPRMPLENLQMLSMLMHRDQMLLHALGINPQASAGNGNFDSMIDGSSTDQNAGDPTRY